MTADDPAETLTAMVTTRNIVGTSSARLPSSARRAASTAYATEDTGSAMTEKAKAISNIVRDRGDRESRLLGTTSSSAAMIADTDAFRWPNPNGKEPKRDFQRL